MTVDAESWLEELGPLLRRRWLLVGVGNDLRGDDGIGSRLARRVAGAGVPAIDAGIAPENFTAVIRRAAPEVLLLADAAELGAAPGAIRVLRPEDLVAGGTCTHDPSLAILIAFLRSDRDLEVRILAVQPRTRVFGAPPSAEVIAAEARLGAALIGASAGSGARFALQCGPRQPGGRK